MSLLQGVLRSNTVDIDKKLKSMDVNDDNDDDEFVNVVSLPGTPDQSRPPSPPKGASNRPAPGPLYLQPKKDPLRRFPTEISQRIFGYLSIQDLAKCARVSRKWRRSQTINYVWFQHYRKDNFQDDSLPPGKWTRKESKQDWRVTHLRIVNDRTDNPPSVPPSGVASPRKSGTQTPREVREEQWQQEAEAAAKPGKLEMRGMYKELGGRKAKSKAKFGGAASRDKGGWEGNSDW